MLGEKKSRDSYLIFTCMETLWVAWACLNYDDLTRKHGGCSPRVVSAHSTIWSVLSSWCWRYGSRTDLQPNPLHRRKKREKEKNKEISQYYKNSSLVSCGQNEALKSRSTYVKPFHCGWWLDGFLLYWSNQLDKKCMKWRLIYAHFHLTLIQ